MSDFMTDFVARFVERRTQRETVHPMNAKEAHESDEDEPLVRRSTDSSRVHVSIVVAEHGEGVIGDIIKFTYDELKALHAWLGLHLFMEGRGRRSTLEPIDELYLLLIYLTSGMTFKQVGSLLLRFSALIHRTVHNALDRLQAPIEQVMPKNLDDCPAPTTSFATFADAFGIVDASPIFIERPIVNQGEYYSGKYKRPCIKVQAFVNPDGLCLHLSKVSKGAGHDKRLFDASGLVELLSFQAGHRTRHKIILADLSYQGIRTTIPEAILPHKKPPNGTLSQQEKDFNKLLSRDRFLVENFFGRWKSLFGIVAGRFRGDRNLLAKIVPITIGLTN
jgi:hypothetical protein